VGKTLRVQERTRIAVLLRRKLQQQGLHYRRSAQAIRGGEGWRKRICKGWVQSRVVRVRVELRWAKSQLLVSSAMRPQFRRRREYVVFPVLFIGQQQKWQRRKDVGSGQVALGSQTFVRERIEQCEAPHPTARRNLSLLLILTECSYFFVDSFFLPLIGSLAELD